MVVDLEKYFLFPALGRPTNAMGMGVVRKLLESLQEGRVTDPLTEFGFDEPGHRDVAAGTCAKGLAAGLNSVDGKKQIGPPGTDIGPLELEPVTLIEGGHNMFRVNGTRPCIYHPLAEKADADQDMWVYKCRVTEFWGGTGAEEVLRARGVRTLFFSGANTDQCIGDSIRTPPEGSETALFSATHTRRRALNRRRIWSSTIPSGVGASS